MQALIDINLLQLNTYTYLIEEINYKKKVNSY